jgi:hypothetical protein
MSSCFSYENQLFEAEAEKCAASILSLLYYCAISFLRMMHGADKA